MAFGHLVRYLQKSSDDFNYGKKKVSENKTVRNFRRSKFLQHSKKLAPKLSFMPGFMERTLVATLLEIRNGLIKFVLFSRRCIHKTQYCILTAHNFTRD